MWELHNSPNGGHSGQEATLRKVALFFWWPQLKAAVKTYVQTYDVCRRVKSSNSHPLGLLQPLPIPQQAWLDISMDFIEGLPKSNDKNCILVVIDRLTKTGHFIALTHPFSATMVAQIFLDNVYKLHGIPLTIVTDRDRIFTNQFWSAQIGRYQASPQHFIPSSNGWSNGTFKSLCGAILACYD